MQFHGQITQLKRFGSQVCLFLALLLLCIAGCGQSGNSNQELTGQARNSPNTATADLLGEFNAAYIAGDWNLAWQRSQDVLTQAPNDPTLIAKVARAAHEAGHSSAAADLLMDACRLESFTDLGRMNLAVTLLTSQGRVFECLELMKESLKEHPERHPIRRRLYDLQWGLEDRLSGTPHGRLLIRQRQIDKRLLLTIGHREARTETAAPLTEMAKRNPKDNRPLIAEATKQAGQGNLETASKILSEILNQNPDYAIARVMKCRVDTKMNDGKAFVQTAKDYHASLVAYPRYWIAFGDWAKSTNQQEQAARAYWEATRRDPDIREAWLKLYRSLNELENIPLDSASMSAIESRVNQLNRYSQLKDRFDQSGQDSPQLAIEIAQSLQSLGRLWEAEAWAAIAVTLSGNSSEVNQARDAIVKQLAASTPWQSPRAELEIELPEFPPPDFSQSNLIAKDTTSRNRFTDSRTDESKIVLRNEAKDRGLDFFGRTADELERAGVMAYQTLGCGGGVIDFDLDGWSDLYLIAAGGTPPNNSAPNALMRNTQGQFIDVSLSSETDDLGFGQGLAVGDVNEDGFPDLLCLNYGPNVLLINNGDGTFSKVSDIFSTDSLDWSSSGAIADVDGDALADLIVLNYGAGDKPITHKCGNESNQLFRACSPLVFAGYADRFLANDSSGGFVDATDRWNVNPSITGRGLGVIVGELDGRTGVDVFVANDMTSNHFWSQESFDTGAFRLSESAVIRGLASDNRSVAQGSMGIAAADFDHDGDSDIYVTNFVDECNTYHENQGTGGWRDLTSQRKLYDPSLPMVGFGTQAIDFENDGVLEIIVSNGHVDDYPEERNVGPYKQPVQLFRRNARGEYDSIGSSVQSDYFQLDHIGRALWSLDANRDGRTDVAITHQTEPVALLVNRSAADGNWIVIKLVGRSCSRDAIGAKVKIQTSDQTWTAAMNSGDGYLCSNEKLIRVGLGDTLDRCKIQIEWPDGTEQQYENVSVNREYVAVQGFELFPLRLDRAQEGAQ